MDLLAKLSRTISTYKLLQPGDGLLLAVSGGADSTAMLHLFCRLSSSLPLRLAVASLDHGLRPEARQEIAFVAQLAGQYGIPFVSDTIHLKESGTTGLEARGRRLRYQFLEKSAQAMDIHKVAVAHHADDQAETVLAHLFTGSGIEGLSGMDISRPIVPGSDVLLLRPLWDMRKQELITYLQAHGYTWHEDASNDDLQFTRNRLRHRIVPCIESHGYSDLVMAIHRSAGHARDIVAFLQQQAADRSDSMCAGWSPQRPDLERLMTMVAGKQWITAVSNLHLDAVENALWPFVIRKILARIGCDDIEMRYHHYQTIRTLAEQGKGLVKLPDGVVVARGSQLTCFAGQEPELMPLPLPLYIPGTTAISRHAGCQAAILPQAAGEIFLHLRTSPPPLTSAYLDMGTLQLPLAIRRWQAGDTFWPLGSKGQRKISDILTDLKIPQILRRRVLVLADASHTIVWLLGIAIAHPCRIRPESCDILALQIVST